MDGILRCSLYAFGPNRLHYCGPDANHELLSYIDRGLVDPGLEALLKQFRTLYPYLNLIARANGIADPFDDRVVEAYWIGNELLEGVGKRKLFRHLEDGLDLKRKMTLRGFGAVTDRIGLGAVPHHSFHVLSVWKRTNDAPVEHSLESLDNCRISWGEVVSVSGPKIEVLREPLIESGGRLTLGPPVKTTVLRSPDCREDIDAVKAGDIITMHWGVPCEVVTPAQAATLRKYTAQHLAMAVVPG